MKRILLLALLALVPLLAQAAGDPQPLPPDQVYKLSATATPGTISVHWDILPGYYLYKSKFQFVSHVTSIKLGAAAFPAGETKEDPYFGKQEIYHKGVTATVPYSGTGKLDLELVYQGCAEMGFCYPPQHKHVSLDLVAATLPTAAPIAAGDVQGRTNAAGGTMPGGASGASSATTAVHPTDLAALLTNKNDTGDVNNFLPVDQAFQFTATAKDANTLELRWQIAAGYYLYRQKFHLSSDNPDVELGTPDFPQGEIKNDPYMGTSEIYSHDVDVLIPVTRSNDAARFNLQAVYQGCAEAGFCYPPVTKLMPIDLVAAAPLAGANPSAAPLSDQNRLVDLLTNGSLLAVMLTFFGFGMLLTFTPCVLPMIPIISGIIVGQGKKLSTARAFSLSLTYVLAMALVYAGVGVVVGVLGSNIQLALQNPWVLSVFSLIFVGLALSLFGFYELQMPSAVQTWLTKHSNSQQSGAYIGVAIMGMLSALICGPCITAPLVAALVFIGQTGSALRGGLALFALGLGMGVPLLIVGTSAGRLLPKAGPWMNAVKHVFGVIMLGLAIWFISRVIPGPMTLGLWGALAIVCGVYLGALEGGTHGWKRLWRGLGLMALMYGFLLLVGAATGGDDPFKPLAKFGMATSVATVGEPGATKRPSALPFKQIKNLADLDREIAAAGGKPVMLDFAADWCVACKELEHDTYSDPTVQAALKDVVLLQADVTAYDDDDKAIFQRYSIYGPPTVLFFGPDGKELSADRVTGYEDRDKFLQSVHAAVGTPK